MILFEYAFERLTSPPAILWKGTLRLASHLSRTCCVFSKKISFFRLYRLLARHLLIVAQTNDNDDFFSRFRYLCIEFSYSVELTPNCLK